MLLSSPEPTGLDEPKVYEVMEALGKGYVEPFKRLRPVLRERFLRMAAPLYLGEGGDKAALEALYAVDYERVPPDPKTFLESNDYIGHHGRDMFPAWRPYFLKACDPTSNTHEIIITGASGNGKTTFALSVIAYKLARMLCLRDPAKFYDLQSGTKIYFALYALTKKLITQVGFYDLRDKIIDQSPFFRDVYPREPHGQEYIRWGSKAVEVIVGSNILHALGRSIFAVVGDELNYFDQGEKTVDKAQELVSEVSGRLESRFVTTGGDIPGVAIFISQTRMSSDFLEQRYKKLSGKQGVMTIRGPRWDFALKGYNHEDGFHAGDPTFRVYTGSDTTDPRIIDHVTETEDGESKVEPVDPDQKTPADGVIGVPVVHYRQFEENIHNALRTIADVASGSFSPFFSRREVIESAFTSELTFPFSAQVIPCHEKSQDNILKSAFDIMSVTQIHMGRRRPIRHPNMPRYIHLDLSETGDRTGFAMIHPSRHYVEERREGLAQDIAQVGESEVIMDIEVDFYVAIVPGPYGEPIDYRKIRVCIDWLRRCGYWIRYVTGDSHQSFDMLQRLREAGFLAEKLSVDKTPKPYRELRNVLSEGRLSLPFPPNIRERKDIPRILLYQELGSLEYDIRRDKVDHRKRNLDGSKGSKDIGDGVAGAVYRCVTDKVAIAVEPPVVGKSTLDEKRNRYLSQI